MNRRRGLILGGMLGALSAYWLKRYLQPEHSPLIFEESVVLVTGASSGIGRAYANVFARAGAKLILVARRAELLETVRQEITPYAAEVLALPADVTDPAELETLVETVLEHFGQIDVLINNAGVSNGGPLQTISLESIHKTIDVNLTGAICLTNLCLPSMLARRSGKIVNVASIAGVLAWPFLGAYSASKHGLVAFSDALRRELEGTGVDVISVLPFWTYSDIINPEVAKVLKAWGEPIDTPELVADYTLEGMLKGQHDIYFGGWRPRIGAWLDRHLPWLLNLYLRATVTPEYIAMIRELQPGSSKS